MGRIVAFTSVTLDGVMQSPARPDEDTRGGFRHGGWGIPYSDRMTEGLAGEGGATTGGLLLGRRTYEDFYEVWPKRTDNPFTPILNASPKYVASRTLREPLPWENSILLGGDAIAAVAELRATLDKDLVVLGSGELIRSLLPHGLIDRFVLLITPLVLGSGTRLFADGTASADLRLVDSRASTKGVIVATYEVTRARPA
jgi:dihydrofolate reductase